MLYVEILSGLWVGDVEIMYNKKFLNDNDINIIINCTIDYQISDIPTIKHIRIPLTDNIYNSVDTIIENKDKILNFIDTSMETNNLLICCYDGKTIAPYIISLYLIKYADIPKSEIKKIIQSKNTEITMEFETRLFDL